MSKELIIFNWDNTLSSPDSDQLFMGVKNLLNTCIVERRRIAIICDRNIQNDIKDILNDNEFTWVETNEKRKKRKLPLDDYVEPCVIRIFTPDALEKSSISKPENIKIDLVNYIMQLEEYQIFNKSHVLFIDDEEKSIHKARENGYESLKVERSSHKLTAIQGFYRKVKDFMAEHNSYLGKKGMIVGSIDEYIKMRNDEFKINKSHYNTRFLGIGFGYPVEKKNAAALALKLVLLGLEKEESLAKHQGPLSQGRLSTIYKNYLAYKIDYQQRIQEAEQKFNGEEKSLNELDSSINSAYYNPYENESVFHQISLK